MSVSLYSDDQEQNIYIGREAETWHRSALIDGGQLFAVYKALDISLRRTNLFFRILFFIFTGLGVGAAVGLLVWIMESSGDAVVALVMLFCALVCYITAEGLVRKVRLYRHGLEEALAMASMILWLAGFLIAIDNLNLEHWLVSVGACLILAASACLIYLRFGYLYAVVIGMISLCAIPFQFSLPHVTERLILLLMLCAALALWLYRDGKATLDFKKDRCTLILACLLAAVYLTVNLHVANLIGSFIEGAGAGHFRPESFPPALYWASYVLTFLLPAVAIFAGIKSRRRPILNIGLAMAVATLTTNKSYLGFARYAWDPAILGLVMVGLSLFLTRRLNAGPEKNRSGFTARAILKPEDHGMTLADAAAALTPGVIEAGRSPGPGATDAYLEGGASGGGGAQRKV